MKWEQLTAINQLEEIKKESINNPVLIFKHSTRCSISKTSLDRLERKWNDAEMTDIKPYYLDLLSYRPVSNEIAMQFDVEHESPQILLIENGKPVLHLSHFDIDYERIKNTVTLKKSK